MLVRSMQRSIPKYSCSDGLIPKNPQVPGPTHLWTRRPPAANGDYLASVVDYLPSVSRKRSVQHLLQDGRIPRNSLSPLRQTNTVLLKCLCVCVCFFPFFFRWLKVKSTSILRAFTCPWHLIKARSGHKAVG